MKAVHARKRSSPTRFFGWCGVETLRYEEGAARPGQILISDRLKEVTCRMCRRLHKASFKERDDER